MINYHIFLDCINACTHVVNQVLLFPVGMLISFSQHKDSDVYSREHVFYFDYDGCLHGVLLCLNPGPRSFFPVYLHGNTDNEGQGEGTSRGGWYVYLRDGRDGIMCIRLQ